MKKLFIILPVLFLLNACKEETNKQILIDQEVSNAVMSFRLKRLRECRMVALDSANKIVDSIIIARNTMIDSSVFSGKPIKPLKPVIKSPLDTTPVVPILPKRQ